MSKDNSVKETTAQYKDIDYSLINEGPLYIPEGVKRPDFEYCFVGNLPGQIEKYQTWGYEVIKEDDMPIGLEKPNRASPFGAAVTVHSKCGQILVLMAIHKELHKKLMAHRHSKVDKIEASIGKIDGIPDKHQSGDVKIFTPR